MEPRRAAESRAQLARVMGVMDANNFGFVHGGTVMRMCDETAGVVAMRHAGGPVVTAGMDRMTFLHRIHPGEIISLTASVNAAWRTSMEVGVRVEAEDTYTGRRRHTNTAYLTMVAVDADGRPVAVPPLVAETPDERRREREAQLRRANRLAERERMLREREGEGADKGGS